LVASEKSYFTEIVSEAPSPCGDPTTIQTCVLEKRACATCVPAAEDVARFVRQGEYKSDVLRWLGLRFDASKKLDAIPLDQHPVLGRKDAPIEIVEFADFECPFCGVAAPKVHALIEKDPKYANKVRLVFYNMPLKAHAHADAAARAAWAAHLQGKFWAMHDQLFAHQDKLEDADLESYAKAVGCDLGKWKTAFAAAPTEKRMNDDYALGEKIGVEGTPSFFVNRRKFTSLGADEFEVQIRRWLDEELIVTAPPAK
jgi:protein-disulfide isomerase